MAISSLKTQSPNYIIFVLIMLLCFTGCGASKKGNSVTVVKPRYHHTWYKKHTYKKKWHIGRIWVRPEKQGVKKVRVQN